MSKKYDVRQDLPAAREEITVYAKQQDTSPPVRSSGERLLALEHEDERTLHTARATADARKLSFFLFSSGQASGEW